MNIYVGNLPYSTTSEDLQEMFNEFGEVSSSNIIMDRESGRSKGFGFVEMSSASEAEEAIKALDGTNMGGRNLKVNEARPREERPRGPRY
ncbi:MAG: RNA-binding protein [Gammaproteobacteria bacterium]|nr:RNA-binding protein [Gammaproteobacteria bacterium]